MSLQRRAITLQTNSPRRLTVFLVAFFLTAIGVLFSAGAFAQQQQAPISPSKQPPAPSAPPHESSPDTYKIRTQVNLVVLHVSVLNDRSVFVPGLMEDNFRVLEDKVEQKLSVFKQEDVPVSFGLVVDNSGSMRDKRPQVNAAALTFVKTGEDDASTHSLENAIERAQRADAVIYAVGVFSDEDIKHDRRAMKKARTALTDLANATGGLAFFPETADDTEAICTQIAHDIRNQYTIAYYPTNTCARVPDTMRPAHPPPEIRISDLDVRVAHASACGVSFLQGSKPTG